MLTEQRADASRASRSSRMLAAIGYGLLCGTKWRKVLVAAKICGYLARKDGGEWLTVGVNKKGAD
jgi:hypothetical protein